MRNRLWGYAGLAAISVKDFIISVRSPVMKFSGSYLPGRRLQMCAHNTARR